MEYYKVGDRVRVIATCAPAYGKVGVVVHCDTTDSPQIPFYIVAFGKVIPGVGEKMSDGFGSESSTSVFLDYELARAEECKEETATRKVVIEITDDSVDAKYFNGEQISVGVVFAAENEDPDDDLNTAIGAVKMLSETNQRRRRLRESFEEFIDRMNRMIRN